MRDPNQEIEIRPNGTVRVRTINTEKSMTDQQFAAECDINNIMKKYDNRINAVPFSGAGVYADFTGITDYRDMLDTVNYANEAFMSLPATVRSRFGNDPAQILAFLQDKNNYDEGVKMGLLQPKQNMSNAPTKTNDSNDQNIGAKKQKTKTAADPQTSSDE